MVEAGDSPAAPLPRANSPPDIRCQAVPSGCTNCTREYRVTSSWNATACSGRPVTWPPYCSIVGDATTLSGALIESDQLSGDDREAWRAFHDRTGRYARLLARVFESRPPKLVESNLADRLTLLRLGLGLKLLGRDDMSDLMRIVLTNMYDLMEEYFDSPQLKAVLSFDSVLGAAWGRAPRHGVRLPLSPPGREFRLQRGGTG